MSGRTPELVIYLFHSHVADVTQHAESIFLQGAHVWRGVFALFSTACEAPIRRCAPCVMSEEEADCEE